VANELNFAGDRLDVTIRAGGSAPFGFKDFEDELGAPVTTITAASLKFYSGVPSGATTITVIVAPTMTIVGGGTVTGELTPTQTRLFVASPYEPGQDFCYGFEVTTADGRVYPICWGTVDVLKELPA
jgi:hypothetical protein